MSRTLFKLWLSDISSIQKRLMTLIYRDMFYSITSMNMKCGSFQKKYYMSNIVPNIICFNWTIWFISVLKSHKHVMHWRIITTSWLCFVKTILFRSWRQSTQRIHSTIPSFIGLTSDNLCWTNTYFKQYVDIDSAIDSLFSSSLFLHHSILL